MTCIKVIFLIIAYHRTAVQIALRDVLKLLSGSFILFKSRCSVSVPILKTVYMYGFHKYVNQVHISLEMQMSLMRKDNSKQTKEQNVVNSSHKRGKELLLK